MKVTFILQDFTPVFYDGNGGSITGLLQLDPTAQFEKLNSMAHDGRVKMRVGSCNAFRDRVELNQIRRNGKHPAFKLEPRRGYKLATFEFAA